MELVDRHGLTLALIDAAELDAQPWTRAEQVSVVRMIEPSAACGPRLAELGFIRKPARITWTAPLGVDEDVFLARLDTKTRQDVRRARRRAASLVQVVEDGVSAESVDRFLTLYRERIAQMRNGLPLAVRHRASILRESHRYYGVYAYDDGDLVGGCLVQECPDEDTVRIRFSAVTETWRRLSLARVLYFAAMQVARDKGYARAGLGTEPNLYGHITRPGLAQFKADLGFTPHPSQEFADPEGADEADLILHLRSLGDPAMILGYGVDGLVAHVFTGSSVPPATAHRSAGRRAELHDVVPAGAGVTVPPQPELRGGPGEQRG